MTLYLFTLLKMAWVNFYFQFINSYHNVNLWREWYQKLKYSLFRSNSLRLQTDLQTSTMLKIVITCYRTSIRRYLWKSRNMIFNTITGEYLKYIHLTLLGLLFAGREETPIERFYFVRLLLIGQADRHCGS